MLIQGIVGAEVLREGAEVPNIDNAALVVVRVAEVSTVVCVGVNLIGVHPYRAVVEVVCDSVTIKIGLGNVNQERAVERGRGGDGVASEVNDVVGLAIGV